MQGILINNDGKVLAVHEDISRFTENELKELTLLDNIPEPQQIEGKQAIMYWNPEEKNVFYKYVDIPKTPEQIQQDAQDVIDQIIVDNLNMQMQIDTLITSSL